MPDKEKCFIIMPLTTPENMHEIYRDGKDHFMHVLECLFVPAVEKAGFTPEPPIAKGSDLIHAEIIKTLETSGMVLCDMSTLNANVFFEFGIRTSLNKPVCVIKDELTTKVPFDTGILNYEVYDSSIEPWKLNDEIEKIATHLKTSAERSKGENALWRHFGFRSEAVPYKVETDTDSKLDYLSYQLDSLRQSLKSSIITPEYLPKEGKLDLSQLANSIVTYVRGILDLDIKILSVKISKEDELAIIEYEGNIPRTHELRIEKYIRDNYGFNAKLESIRKTSK